MLTRLVVKNFKRFREVDVELGPTVVCIGPNNSGKTSVLQALTLWQVGLRKWLERRPDSEIPKKRPGVTINRNEVVALSVPAANLLWKDLRVSVERREGKARQFRRIPVELTVHGVTRSREWICGLEFEYINEESFVCRPLKLDEHTRMPLPEEAKEVLIAFLPPMSGLASHEIDITTNPDAIEALIGQGRTAEVLRNLCYRVYRNQDAWNELVRAIRELFGVEIEAPTRDPRGELEMRYRDRSDLRLDISSSGRGLQQTLLLLAYIQVNPNAVLLLDEPDAHLELLRQREIYQKLTEFARARGNQIIAASHSEVLLNEAADRDVVIAFVGKPHRIDDRSGRAQTVKALKDIGFEHYYQAELRGWALYLEGATDLAILRSFARTLGHPAEPLLRAPFVHYVANHPPSAEAHFFGLREAKPELVGVAVYDRLDRPPNARDGLRTTMWSRREIENYLCAPEVLRAYAKHQAATRTFGPLFESAELARFEQTMSDAIELLVPRIALQDPTDRWWIDTKASDDFLDRLFERFFGALGLPNVMRKTDYHQLASLVPTELIAPEIRDVLDLIVRVAGDAHPSVDEDC